MATNTTAYTAGTRLKVIEGCKIPTPLTDFVIKEDLRGLYLGDDKARWYLSELMNEHGVLPMFSMVPPQEKSLVVFDKLLDKFDIQRVASGVSPINPKTRCVESLPGITARNNSDDRPFLNLVYTQRGLSAAISEDVRIRRLAGFPTSFGPIVICPRYGFGDDPEFELFNFPFYINKEDLFPTSLRDFSVLEKLLSGETIRLHHIAYGGERFDPDRWIDISRR